MNLPEISEKIKIPGARGRGSDLFFVGALLVAVALVSFALGRFSVGVGGVTAAPASAVSVSYPAPQGADVEVSTPPPEATTAAGEDTVAPGMYVGSKNSNKYHLPWCAGARSISDANKVWFSSKAEAEAAGYVPASNCKGI